MSILRMFMAILLCFVASKGYAASKPFEIGVQIIGKTEFVRGTPAIVLITIRNISGGNRIQVFEGLWYKDGQPCGNVIEEAMPSSDKQVIVAPPIVPKEWNAKFSYDVAEFCQLAEPGTYELEYRVPLGFHGSPPVDPLKLTVKIVEASKEEKEVYDSLQECYSSLKQVNLGPCWGPLLKNHPNSIYAAWIILPYLGEPEKYQPEIAKSLLEMPNEYPSGNAVPDPEYGSRDIPYGELMAQWQMEWAQRILVHHPDFPFAERLQLVVALNKFVLKNEKESNEMLLKLSQNNSEIGEWSLKFLSLKGQK